MRPIARRVLLPVAIALVLAAGLAAVAFFAMPGPQSARASLVGGPFTMTGETGKVVTDADLRGRPTLLFFGYTHCPDVCPTSLFQISQVFAALGPKADVAAYFVTVDPERDPPAVMREYMSNFDPRMHGLSGDPAQTAAIEKDYRVYAKKAPAEGNGDYLMDHTAIVYLLDKNGRFVNAFNLDRPPAEAAKDLSGYF
jgi:protein SCO1/2